MRKILMGIVTILCLLHTHAYSINYTNKTFMTLPTPHHYLPMKYSCWHRILKQGSSAKTPWGATMQAVPFFRMSNNAAGLGKYFGTNFKQVVTIGTSSPESDVRGDHIIHKEADGLSPIRGTLTLNPKHSSYGLYLSFHQELNNINKGLFFELNIPLQKVENDLRMTVTNEAKSASGGVRDYFVGNLRQTDAVNLQEPLQYLKLCGPRDKTGIADIELIIGHKLADKQEQQLSGALKIIMPTGQKSSPYYLFAPVVGNNKHWGIGANFKGSLNVTRGDDYSLECLFDVDYTYLFRSDETRTLGYRKGFDDVDTQLREKTSAVMAWNYFLLAGEAGKQGVFPFANVLTQDVSVEPAGKMQANLSFAYHRNNTTIDFGYSVYAQEGEKVSIKCWEDDKYAPADPTYPTDQAFNVTDYAGGLSAWSIGGPIQSFMLDPNTAATPAVLKHSLHAAISHTISEWENPLVMGAGFSVDWGQDNATARGYTLWCKMGTTF